MEKVDLQAHSREVHGKKAGRLRAEGWIPAVMYGADIPSRSIQIPERELVKALTEAGETTLISLSVGDADEPSLVLAREIQRDILNGRLQHVDFYQVRLTEKVKTSPPLDFQGDSPLVDSGQAVLIYGMTEVEVECLPTDLVSSIAVDVSVLDGFDKNILVGDLPVPPGVTILADPDEVVVSVVSTLTLEEPEVEEEEVELEAVELAEAEAADREAPEEA